MRFYPLDKNGSTFKMNANYREVNMGFVDDLYEAQLEKFLSQGPTFKFALKEGLSDIYLPTRGTDKATGWDVKSTDNVTIEPFEYVKIPLGFRMFTPPGWWMELRPRSSSFAKKNLHALYGVIDEDYEGQCIFAAQYIPNKNFGTLTPLQIQEGEAVGQMVPVRRLEITVERITNEEYEKICKERNASRGSGGFGSTG
jgi:dUTP pyrophosphatase